MGQIIPIKKAASARKTGKELLQHYIQNSSMTVRAVRPSEQIQIELYGELARIPSLKNSKIPGKNFTNPDVTARIKAMDFWFTEAMKRAGISWIRFGDEQLAVIVICAKRSRSFDPIGCAETICDWLEPASKPVGRQGKGRGWGVGLTNNDRFITPIAIHSHQTGLELSHSVVIVRPWRGVREQFLNFITQGFMNA